LGQNYVTKNVDLTIAHYLLSQQFSAIDAWAKDVDKPCDTVAITCKL